LHIIEAAILGIIQGLTEFIPVSSSGHLIAIPKLLGWNDMGMSFDVALHWGTLVALLIFFWRDWAAILSSFWQHVTKGVPYTKDESGRSGRLLIPIIVACIPAAIAGKLLDKKIEAFRDRPFMILAIAGGLAVMAVVMLLAEKMGRRQRDISRMGYTDYVVIGIAQALALIPGVSRSGVTITAGLFRDLDRTASARFSFLLSMPVIFGAGLLKLKDMMKSAKMDPNVNKLGLHHNEILPWIVGFAAAAIFGYLAIKFLMNFLQKNSLKPFAVYRICFAVLMVGLFIMGR